MYPGSDYCWEGDTLTCTTESPRSCNNGFFRVLPQSKPVSSFQSVFVGMGSVRSTPKICLFLGKGVMKQNPNGQNTLPPPQKKDSVAQHHPFVLKMFSRHLAPTFENSSTFYVDIAKGENRSIFLR